MNALLAFLSNPHSAIRNPQLTRVSRRSRGGLGTARYLRLTRTSSLIR
jgi:hypothetical protein